MPNACPRTRFPALGLLALSLTSCSCHPPAQVGADAASIACSPGDTLERACGTCGRAISQCVDGVFVDGPCQEPTSCQACAAGAVQHRPCSVCGDQRRTCSADGTWRDWGTCDLAACPDAGAADAGAECLDGDLWQQACGVCGHRTRGCSQGAWGPWSECVPCADAGAPPGPDASAFPIDDAGRPLSCNEGERVARSCGRCGLQVAACADGTFGLFGACQKEGVCAPGEAATESCGASQGACKAGTRTRTCGTDCGWSAWSECTGATPGAITEACGNGIDDDCDGPSDEGCQCTVASPGSPALIPVGVTIAKLVADPVRCLVYALPAAPTKEILVFDVSSKKEVGRITLMGDTRDIAIDPTGTILVASHPSPKMLSFVDAAKRTVLSTKTVEFAPAAVEAVDPDRFLYAHEWGVRRVARLAGQPEADVGFLHGSTGTPDIELSADRKQVFAVALGTSGITLKKLDVDGPVSETSPTVLFEPMACYWRGAPSIVVGEGRVYLLGYQFDTFVLRPPVECSCEHVLAADRAGRFAVGTDHFLDAETLRPVGALPAAAAVGSLAASDRELWTYEAQNQQIRCTNVSDLFPAPAPGETGLGSRAVTPPSNWSYLLSQLAADPVRPLLYGLDPLRGTVVALSSVSLEPTAELYVGRAPSRLEVDPDGRYAYVGFEEMDQVVVLDLGSFRWMGGLPTKCQTGQLAALADGRFASASEYANVNVGHVASWSAEELIRSPSYPVVTASADGRTFYVAGGNGAWCTKRFDASYGTVTWTAEEYCVDSYGADARASGDGRILFHDNFALELGMTRLYPFPTGSVKSVSPDGRLVISGTGVYRVSDGVFLGSLPRASAVQAVSPDSKTLYLAAPSGIERVDLTAF